MIPRALTPEETILHLIDSGPRKSMELARAVGMTRHQFHHLAQGMEAAGLMHAVPVNGSSVEWRHGPAPDSPPEDPPITGEVISEAAGVRTLRLPNGNTRVEFLAGWKTGRGLSNQVGHRFASTLERA